MSDHRAGNVQASTLDMVLLFGMPVVLIILTAAIWYFGFQLTEVTAELHH